MFRVFSAALALIAFAAAPAEAHTIDTGGALAHGFAHPITGLDHVLAMVAVGLWAAHLGGRARWLVPASFVVVMAVAGGLGVAGFAPPSVETAIALTVVALGALIFARVRMPAVLGMAVVGSFALFHGLAHGLEAPDLAGLGYGAGFVAATAILHGLGLGFGVMMMRNEGGLPRLASRLGGGTAMAAGVVLMVV
ncbi:MAG: HupE/UreJ family protein [Rhodospirillales bacterium]|nr:HupE/UreJ family protein [Rhodospirillales bacterium]